jgi:negative regulator of sigma E activity
MASTSASVIRRRVSMGTVAIVGLLAFAAGVVLAIVVLVEVATLSPGHTAISQPSVLAIQGEQIAHNRSEQGFEMPATIGGEQIAHDRSEAGLSDEK